MRTLSYESGPIWAGSVPLGDTYILGRLIRRGGMSEIFEATHARLPGRFAVKILAPRLVGNREAFARFCREAEILSELRHPNVVQIFDFNTAPDERPYFVMEHLEGRTLETRLADSEPPTVAATVRLVAAVASALAAAHAHGIAHRDLKPANIFLVAVDGQPDELVKVLDFGVSRGRGNQTLISVPSEIQGTPPYMSPEQVQGSGAQVDGRTDQFALAAIAYRMLTGHDAFVAAETSAVLYQIAHEPAPPLARHLPPYWDMAALQSVLDRALAKNPADRYGGMMEFARAFEAAAERLPSPAVERAPITDVAPPPRVLSSAPPEASTPVPAPRGAVGAGPIEASVVPLPIAHPGPEPVPIAHFRPASARTPHSAPALEHDFVERAPIDYADQIPIKHHRAAALGAFVLMVAGLLIATGWYKRLPGTVPVVRQKVAGWLTQRATARIVAAPPAASGAERGTQQPNAAPASTATPTESSSEAPPAAPPAAEAASPAEDVATPPEEAAKPVASGHHHREPRFRGHPGSIELAPPAADAPAVASPTAEGFPIAPPARLDEPPDREPLAPTAPPPASADSPAASPAP